MRSRMCPAVSGRCISDCKATRKQPGFVRMDTTMTVMNGVIAPQDQTDNHFVAEDDDFLDAVSAALNQLTADCKAALQWSHDEADAEAAIQAAEKSFCSIASICKEAGIAVGAEFLGDDDGAVCWDHEHDSLASSPSPAINMPSWTNDDDFHSDVPLHPPPVPVQIRVSAEPQQQDVVLSPSEEIVEVELTDLLTQSHEEMLALQRVFEQRMSDAERAREESELKHAEEVRSLREEVASSRSAMDRVKQEILDTTTCKLGDMQSAIIASQRAIEAGMKDQARYWKSICHELVVEKRNMAQQVAEERGKYTALRAHLVSHDETSTKAAPHSRVRIRSASGDDSIDNIRVCELPPSPVPSLRREETRCNPGSNDGSAACTSSSSTPTGPSSRLVIVPTADSVSESSSREVSPTHSTSSSKTERPTFRRYYLAQKRENRVVLPQQ